MTSILITRRLCTSRLTDFPLCILIKSTLRSLTSRPVDSTVNPVPLETPLGMDYCFHSFSHLSFFAIFFSLFPLRLWLYFPGLQPCALREASPPCNSVGCGRFSAGDPTQSDVPGRSWKPALRTPGAADPKERASASTQEW